jgi:hypothetical protein
MNAGVRRSFHAALRGGLLASSLVITACQPPPDATQDPGKPSSGASVGSVSFALTLGGGYQFDQVTYAISGNGLDRTGTVDVTYSAGFSAVVSEIPFGVGYSAALTTQDVGHKLMPCTGRAMFDVASAATVPVAVHMTCHAIVSPPSVPVPSVAIYTLGALLLALGVARVRPTVDG